MLVIIFVSFLCNNNNFVLFFAGNVLLVTRAHSQHDPGQAGDLGLHVSGDSGFLSWPKSMNVKADWRLIVECCLIIVSAECCLSFVLSLPLPYVCWRWAPANVTAPLGYKADKIMDG